VLLNGVLERLGEVGRRSDGPDRGAAWRTGLRSLGRAPGLSAATILTLGVGIGANVALFSVIRSVLLKPLPYPAAERLVRVWEANPTVDDERHGPSPWNFVDWERSAPTTMESMTAWYLTSGTYRTDAWAEELRSAQVTAEFFRTLGVAPMLGRDFPRDPEVPYGPLMLSYGLWQRLFAASPDVVGQTIVASGDTYEIVGVMPRGFAFPDESVEAWVAWHMPTVYADRPESRTWRFLSGMGRLAPGATLESAERVLDVVAAGLAEAYPDMDKGWDTRVTSLHDDTVGGVRGTLWIAFGSVQFILLLACANVANLLLARMPARLRDIAIRASLGATRARIAAELLAEHCILGVASGIFGVFLGRLLIDLLVALDAGRIPRLSAVEMDGSVFAFTAAVAAATTLLFGLAPVVQTMRGATHGSFGSGVRTTGSAAQRRVREAFVGSQVAIALVLLTGAGLFAASLEKLTQVDPGFEPANVATFRVSLDPVEGSEAATIRYYDGLLQLIDELPGVIAVGATQTLPLSPVSNDFTRPYRPLGSGTASAEASAVQMRIVTPGYVAATGMTVLEGGDLPADARAGEPMVALVNRTLADRLWPSGGAVGESFEIDWREGWQSYRVAGVVQDVKHHGPRGATVPEVFVSHDQAPYLAMTLVVKTVDEPEALFQTLGETVRSHRPMQPPNAFVSMETLLSTSTAEERFLSVLMSILASIGLILASTGVYGVIAYSVGHRRREIGVRMALGAAPDRVVGAVLRQAATIAGHGFALGLVAVVLLGRLVENVLFDVSPNDLRTTLAMSAVLAAVSAVAAYMPARRAASIAPSEAFRAD
jgi:putative ABC transport system permease protein